MGHIPDTIKFKDKNSEVKIHSAHTRQDLNCSICAAISPVGPFGCVHVYIAQRSFSLLLIDKACQQGH